MLQDVEGTTAGARAEALRHAVLEVRVLGAPALVVDGRELRFPPGRPGRLLAALLLARGRVVAAERLVDEVWGEDLPADARSTLHTTVARLRRALGPAGDRLHRRGAGYRFDLADAEIDADVLLERLSRARARREVAEYDAALALWHGQPWAAWADDIAHGESLQLEEAYVAAREERAALLLRDGQVAQAVGQLRVLVAEHPLRDRPVALLMESLHRSGAAAEALAVFTHHRTALAEELGLDPAPELVELQRRVLLREQGEADGGPTSPSSAALPASPVAAGPSQERREAATLYGREQDLHDLRGLLQAHRVVTLVGPGGVGKTALARGATDANGSVWWVDLATVTSEAGVRAVTATALDVAVFPGGTPEAALARRLATAEGLLVLDNCEHVVGPVADLVEEVVARGTGLTVLATSRERLGLPGEQVFWLSPLALPRGDEGDLEAASVVLFLDRARAASPDLVVDAPTAAAVSTLVRALDGLPLAIELAASRVGVVSLSTLQQRLDEHLDILRRHRRRGPLRHQTLTATIAWSYDTLSEEEARAFRWLATFRGPFGLDDAEELLGPGSAEAVLSLVERSMLVRPGSRQDEYRMLETLRSFARGRLDGDDRRRAHRAHARWAASVAARANRGLRTSDEAHWHAVVERRLPDLAAAVRWSLGEDDASTAADIVSELLDWAYFRVRVDVLAWGRELVEHPGDHRRPPAVLAAASYHAWMLGQHAQALDHGLRGVAAGGGHDHVDALPALQAAIDTALAVGDLDRAYDLCRQAHATAATHGMHEHRLVAASGLVLSRVFQGRPCAAELELLHDAMAGVASPSFRALALYSEAEALTSGRPARALELFAEARAMGEAVHARLPVGVSLAAETALRGRVGALDHDTAEQTVRAVEHWLGSGNENLFVTCLRNVVSLLDRFDAHAAVVRLVAATQAHTRDRPSYGAEKERLDAALARARDALPPAELEAAWVEGSHSSLEDAARRTVEELRALA